MLSIDIIVMKNSVGDYRLKFKNKRDFAQESIVVERIVSRFNTNVVLVRRTRNE